MIELLALVLLLILSGLFALSTLVLAFIVAPKAGSNVKNSTYECGNVPFSDAKIQFNAQYFMYAILFLIFDVQIVMLYPIALIFNKLGVLALCEAFMYVFLMLIALIYAAKKNMLRFR